PTRSILHSGFEEFGQGRCGRLELIGARRTLLGDFEGRPAIPALQALPAPADRRVGLIGAHHGAIRVLAEVALHDRLSTAATTHSCTAERRSNAARLSWATAPLRAAGWQQSISGPCQAASRCRMPTPAIAPKVMMMAGA